MKPFNGGQPIILKNWVGGVNNNISDSLAPQNSVKMALNMHTDQEENFGYLRSRMGKRVIADLDVISSSSSHQLTTSSSLRGLFDCGLINPGGMIVGSGRYAYLLDDTNNDLLDIGVAPFDWGAGSSKMRFTKYLNYIFGCNGTYIKSWDGNTANNWGSTNLSSAPTGNLIEEFQGKLFISANSTYKSRVYFSKLPQAGSLPAWDTANDYFDVAPDDGDLIVSIKKSGNLLLIFKYYSLYFWDGTSLVRVDDYGSVSHETVQIINNNVYFLSMKESSLSVCLFNGQKVDVISTPVNQWLKNTQPDYSMASAHTTHITCSWIKNGNYFLSLGPWVIRRDDVGIDNAQNSGALGIYEGGFYANVILKFNTKENSWNELFIPAPNGLFTGFRNYISFAEKRRIEIGAKGYEAIVVGGQASQAIDSTTNLSFSLFYWEEALKTSGIGIASNTVDFLRESDLTYNVIPYIIHTHKIDFGQRGVPKQLNKFQVFVNGDYSNAKFSVRVDGGDWRDFGNLQGKISTFELGEQGHYFEFKIVGFTSDNIEQTASMAKRAEPFVFEGFEFGNIQIEGYEE